MAQGLSGYNFGFLTKRETGFAVCAAVTNIGQSVHSKLLQFSRLYERVSGDRQWSVCVSLGINCSVTRWCFPEKSLCCSIEHVWPGIKM